MCASDMGLVYDGQMASAAVACHLPAVNMIKMRMHHQWFHDLFNRWQSDMNIIANNNVAKELFPEMFAVGKSAKDLIKDKGLEMKSDGNEIEALCSQAIFDDPDAAEKFKGGKEGAINALKGAVMKATRGQANPQLVDETLRRLLAP